MKTNPNTVAAIALLTGCLLSVSGEAQVAAYTQLDINNINARINSVGPLWQDVAGHPGFEVPKGLGRHTMYSSSLWIGGMNSNNELHLAAETFRTVGRDFFSGPVADPAYYHSNEQDYNRLWKLTRAEVDDHIANWNQPGYQAPANLLSWPGNGDPNKGETSQLAPYKDLNNNGSYEPQLGEYPIIRGDMAVYSIFNDIAGVHTETGANPLGIEVHQMVYAFNCPSSIDQHQTVYVNYRIINRSISDYTDTYFGMWSDGDLGVGSDDYIGCDVTHGAYYFYNGSNIDSQQGSQNGYGTAPPIQAVAFIGGPKLAQDGIDNQPSINDPGSVNGFGYGDGIVDNERLGMGQFMFYNNTGGGQGNPLNSQGYSNLLKGIWTDSSPLTYGGNGSATGVPTKFIYPGNSDPMGFGTGGQTQSPWSEIGLQNFSGDRRGVGSFGPMTFEAGQEVELDFAMIFVRDLTVTSPDGALPLMVTAIDFIRDGFENNTTGCGTPIFTGTEDVVPVQSSVSVYPNPTQGLVHLQTTNLRGTLPYTLTDLTGRVVRAGEVAFTNQTLDLTDLSAGVYHLHLNHPTQQETHPIILNPNQ